MRWVRLSLLPIARKAEEAKKAFVEEATTLARQPQAEGNQVALADFLFNLSSSILEANEQLQLLVVLQPIYARQPEYLQSMKRWTEWRCNILERTGQSQEVVKLRRQLAADYPHDCALQQQYAQALANVGDYPAAYNWLDGVLVPASKWLPDEEEILVTNYADLLQQQGRYDDMVEYLAGWVKRNPPSQGIYAHYLSALVWSDHEKQADERIAQWIRDAEEAVRAARRHRCAGRTAARRHGTASSGRVAGDWTRLQPIYQSRRPAVVQDAGRCGDRIRPSSWAGAVADQIMNNYNNFRESDECRHLRKTALRKLLDEMSKLRSSEVVRLLGWISVNDPVVEKPAWEKIAAGLQHRWEAESDWQMKDRFGNMLAGVLRDHLGAESWLAFLRTQLKGSPDESRAGHAKQLFEALLGQPWKQQYEDEVFRLLPQIPEAEDASQRLAQEVAALCRMTDSFVRARFQSSMKAVEHPEKLTRTELRAKQEENLRLARQGYAAQLHKEASGEFGRLASWMNLERLYLDVQLGRDLDKVADECFEMLTSSRSAPPGRTSVPRTHRPRPLR